MVTQLKSLPVLVIKDPSEHESNLHVIPWTKPKKKVQKSRPAVSKTAAAVPHYPAPVMPLEITGYIKVRKHDFL